MAQGDVYAVVGDIGAAKELLPAMQLLEKSGVSVQWFCDASPQAKAGTDVLVKAGVPYFTQMPPAEKPKVIIVGTSATAVDAQLAWTKFGHENGIPVLWVEDLWGTGERKNSLSMCPTEMLVIDDMAAQIAQSVRPDIKTRVVGKPTFSKLPEMLENVALIRAKIRGELGLNDDHFLITVGFGGDPAERAVAQLNELLEHFERYTTLPVFAWRFHPKHPRKDQLWDRAVANDGLRHVDARKYEMDELNLASDLIVANWGNTDPYKALLARVPVVTMLFPDDTDVRIAAGYPKGIPPIIGGHEVWGAKSGYDVLVLFELVFSSRDAVASYTKIDRAVPFLPLLKPGAAERIAAAVKEYM